MESTITFNMLVDDGTRREVAGLIPLQERLIASIRGDQAQSPKCPGTGKPDPESPAAPASACKGG